MLRAARQGNWWSRGVSLAALGLATLVAPLPRTAHGAGLPGSPAAHAPVSRALLDQKHILVAHLVSASPLAKRIEASDDGEAKGHLATARDALLRAQTALAAGDLAAADREFNGAMGSLRAARQLVPAPAADLQADKARHAHLLASVEALQAGYAGLLASRAQPRPAASAEKEEAAADARRRAAELVAAAQELAREARYREANERLHQAQALLLAAYRQNLADPTVVYSRHFANPEEQFDHELARTQGYHALVPVALEKLQPPREAVSAIEGQVAQAKSLESRAREQAARGDWQGGLASLDHATAALERALAIAGVNLPRSTE